MLIRFNHPVRDGATFYERGKVYEVSQADGKRLLKHCNDERNPDVCQLYTPADTVIEKPAAETRADTPADEGAEGETKKKKK